LAIIINRSQRVAKNAKSTAYLTIYVSITANTQLNQHLPVY